ncbi:hypothetical protein ASE06_12715 [Sphingopyxis sp. Root214]|uniref:hypothetical protein n=1 Tax=unclassified Sphingopyxis TaxID=2614943 RepID=UPI0006F2663D|nr:MULTISPECIES: hypothetical protein [unclassified Sphingopyxis]KQZ73259.1 hypothetical protein ASD73_10365 [Sphingopyxis sp. Root154]KRC07406.1 hypothetical protein ASE06_12715 [Sphingopyxis sp. Root214]
MFDPFGQWQRFAAAGVAMQRTGHQTMKTLDGANSVLQARSTLIVEAVQSPWAANYGELGRMLPEKMDAFSRASSAVAAVMWKSQSAWSDHMQHLGTMAMRGRLPTAAELADLGRRNASLMLNSVEATAKLGAAALAPVSRQVDSNVRRLKAAKTPGARASRRTSL